LITLPCASLTDPWASLCVAGIKTLETRKGALLSGFSGPLVIHRTLALCVDYDLSRWGLPVPKHPEGWPEDDRGMALGVVYVTRTFRDAESALWTDEYLSELQRRACFVDIRGRYLSDLAASAWFPSPIKASGKQGRWKIDVPRNYLPAWALEAA